MSDRVTIVAGSGRCGSSLVMQMLDAVGVPTLSERRISFEAPAWTERWYADPRRIEDARGKAVKLLTAMLDERWARYMIGITDFPIGEVQAAMAAERIGILGAARAAKDHRVLELHFEQLIDHPSIAAQQIVSFLGLAAAPRELAGVVVPRSPDCYPGLLEAELLRREEVMSKQT